MILDLEKYDTWWMHYKTTRCPSIFLYHAHIAISTYSQTLSTVILKDNLIGDKSAQHLSIALQNNTVTLLLSSLRSYYYLQNLLHRRSPNWISKAIRSDQTEYSIWRMPYKSTKWRSVSLYHAHIAICTFLQALSTLDLYNSKIGVQGSKHLADALRNNTVSLFLSWLLSYHHLHIFI